MRQTHAPPTKMKSEFFDCMVLVQTFMQIFSSVKSSQRQSDVQPSLPSRYISTLHSAFFFSFLLLVVGSVAAVVVVVVVVLLLLFFLFFFFFLLLLFLLASSSNEDLRVREVKSAIVNQQCLVYKFQCNLCDAGRVDYTPGHPHERVDGDRQKSSSICKHYLRFSEHNSNVPP